MMDGRKACVELCETSRLALYLARLGQGARRQQAPLFSLPFLESDAGSGSLLRESADPPGFYGNPPTAIVMVDIASGAKGKNRPSL